LLSFRAGQVDSPVRLASFTQQRRGIRLSHRAPPQVEFGDLRLAEGQRHSPPYDAVGYLVAHRLHCGVALPWDETALTGTAWWPSTGCGAALTARPYSLDGPVQVLTLAGYYLLHPRPLFFISLDTKDEMHQAPPLCLGRRRETAWE
jgi:hypothetical protein